MARKITKSAVLCKTCSHAFLYKFGKGNPTLARCAYVKHPNVAESLIICEAYKQSKMPRSAMVYAAPHTTDYSPQAYVDDFNIFLKQ